MHRLSIETARTILSACSMHAKAAGLKPMAVAIVDAGGHLIAFERAEGAAPGRFELAYGKASGAAMLGISGRRQSTLCETHPAVMNAANAALAGRFVPAAGAVLIKNSAGEIIGAVGVSGDMPEGDEAAAVAGITAAGLAFEP